MRVEQAVRGRLVGCLLSVALAWSGGAHAGEDAVAAEALFNEARKAMDSGDFPTACDRFRESQRLEPAVGTLMNLAVCEEKIGKLASAWQHWREALDTLPPQDDRRTFAEQRLAALRPRLPYVVLVAPAGAPRELQVSRNGVKLSRASFGIELPVDPGEHEFVVSAPGREDKRLTVQFGEAERRELTLELGPPKPESAPSANATEARKRSAGSNPKRTLGFVIGGVGVVGVGGAIASGLMLNSKRATVEDECDADKRCTSDGLDAAEAGKRLLVINTAAWGVGVVGLGVGTALVLTRSNRPERARSQTALTLEPTLGGAFLSWKGNLR
jgi:hypothetical protein